MKKIFNIILFLLLFSGNVFAVYYDTNIPVSQMQSTSALYISDHYNNIALDNNGIAVYPYSETTYNNAAPIKKGRGLDVDPDDVPIGYLPVGDLSFIEILVFVVFAFLLIYQKEKRRIS